jgi:hypothetical protein
LQIKQRKLRPELKAKRIPPCPVPHPSRQRSDFDRNCLLLRVLALRTLRNAVGVRDLGKLFEFVFDQQYATTTAIPDTD